MPTRVKVRKRAAGEWIIGIIPELNATFYLRPMTFFHKTLSLQNF
jgi:hypothetical protein